jgi:hypothetical protein
MVTTYEKNLVNLINDVRKDLKAPRLPIVIGEFTGAWLSTANDLPAEAAAIRSAQQQAAAKFDKDTVLFVATRDFVRKAEDSPNPSHGHHEFGNAETYFLVGDALAKGMLTLTPKK